MNIIFREIISSALGISEKQVEKTVELLEEGSTIPFISRYRKEVTSSLDEVEIGKIDEQLKKLTEISARKETILKSIEEQGQLTDELKNKIEKCWDSVELEDIYLPYKAKRKTRASIAKEKGLEGLAKIVMAQNEQDVFLRAEKFINKEVETVEDALQGARDIIAEWIAENQNSRKKIRWLFSKEAIIKSKLVKAKEEEGIKFKDYFDYEEKLSKCPSHRILAIRRGEDAGFLKINISPFKEKAIEILERIFIKHNSNCPEQITLAVKDSYQRLLKPSIETEFRNSSKEIADDEAINVFSKNLRQLLLEAPLGQKRVLAIDPGFTSGCKIVCLDEQGNLEHNQNIYPHGRSGNIKMASKQLRTLVSSFKIDVIAIGNGTASRETEFFVSKIRFTKDVRAFVVSEDGASIYSASEVAREEFAKYDVTVRGAVSIGRRLMDPLAELVKIDPKSIGVGQYQHDVEQNKLKQSLDKVTESCVNLVGVNINTASKHLLMYVSGLGPQLAKNIVEHRTKEGAFKSRMDLKKIKRMGGKAFEQCAGFLRITNGENKLDNTSVHPESYNVVTKMMKKNNCSLEKLIGKSEIREKINAEDYVDKNIGLPTINDILKELAKPGRDPRKAVEVFEFDKNVRKIEDLEVGMKLAGIVTNITNFGAFIDVGVKQDGLVHISELADKFVSDPNEIVTMHQQVEVKVKSIDIERKRIGFSMKNC
ncbi:MAG: Tex family protein [Bacteroidota bacterium]|nr:Tex family protein [Bacteroidota bacterium]